MMIVMGRKVRGGGFGDDLSSSSWLVSLATVSLASYLVVCLLDWHSISSSSSSSADTTASSSSSSLQPWLQQEQRLLLQSSSSSSLSSSATATLLVASSFDDDITRDDVCRDYLMNFLNGTTDAKDTCQAMYKAFQVADCQDYQQKPLIVDKNNNNSTDDDILIDDAFEHYTCCSSVSDYYGRHCQEQSVSLDAYKLLGIVAVLIICGATKSLLRTANVLRWIPDAGACILVGALVGGILRLVHLANLGDKLLAFNNDLFLQIMLPPIVFEASLTIEKSAFRRDLFPILTFSIVGTFLSALAIAWITFHLSNLQGIGGGGGANYNNTTNEHTGGGLPWLDSLLFGSLMSSIDPVATLGILSGVGVSQSDTLYTLIFGESLLNDGVSIVLFNSLLRHMGDADVVDRATIQDTLCNFLLVTFVSIAIGYLCGSLATFYFYALQGKQKAVGEVALFFAWALVPYYVADGLGFSGIIAIMVMGFMMDYYVIGGNQSDEGEWMEYMEMRCSGGGSGGNDATTTTIHHPVEPCFGQIKATCSRAFSGKGLILSRSRHHVGFVAAVLSSIMETSIFSYLGLFLFNDRIWSFGMTVSGLFACVSSRAGMVVLLSLLINACVWIDLEGLLGRLWRFCCPRQQVNNSSGRNEDDSIYSDTRVFLDCKTQLILFSAGVRGAVSYALVQNIPVYDAVTKHGSHFKAELRSMTSATIVILLFTLGALTYFTVQRDLSPDRERVAGPLTHRLLSISLDSGEGDGVESEMNSSFEIDGRPNSFHGRDDPHHLRGGRDGPHHLRGRDEGRR